MISRRGAIGPATLPRPAAWPPGGRGSRRSRRRQANPAPRISGPRSHARARPPHEGGRMLGSIRTTSLWRNGWGDHNKRWDHAPLAPTNRTSHPIFHGGRLDAHPYLHSLGPSPDPFRRHPARDRLQRRGARIAPPPINDRGICAGSPAAAPRRVSASEVGGLSGPVKRARSDTERPIRAALPSWIGCTVGPGPADVRLPGTAPSRSRETGARTLNFTKCGMRYSQPALTKELCNSQARNTMPSPMPHGPPACNTGGASSGGCASMPSRWRRNSPDIAA